MKKTILVMLGLFLIIGTATAYTDLSSSAIYSSPNGWLVANGVDSSTIKVQAMSSSVPLSDANVTFSVIDPLMGTISPSSGITDPNGMVTAVYTTGTKSGTAVIQAIIRYPNGDGTFSSYTLTHNQSLDHDTVTKAVFSFTDQVAAGAVTPFTVTLTDRWGNRVDNKNTAEVITLHMNGAGGSGLWDGSGYVTVLSVPVDAEGNVSVNVRVSTLAGSNPVTMDPIGSIYGINLQTIEGVSGSPWYMSQIVSADAPASCSSPLSCPADGVHPFNLWYTILDQNNNPVKNTSLLFQYTRDSVVSTPYPTTTNASGVAYLQFTRATMGTYTLTAKASDNSTILCTGTGTTGYCSQDVTYYATAPADMQVVANPQMMVSRDVDATVSASVMARVMDATGNPVTIYDSNPVTVTFSKSNDSFPDAPAAKPYKETTPSSLSATTATMGSDGFATVQFYPGSFVTYGDVDYNATATGQATVTASWTTPLGTEVKRPVTLIWKNYPYLSVSASASTTDAYVGDPLNITIQIKGDGAALQPKPINVALCIDRSGSMLYDNPDRMYSIREAAKSFVDQMSTKDSVALVTFGYKGTIKTPGYNSGLISEINNVYSTPKTYSDYATVDKSLTRVIDSTTVTALKNALDGIVPDYGTPMREGLKDSVQALPAASSGTVNAIILLSDGDYNHYGDPLARGHGYTSSQYDPTAYNDLDSDYMKYAGVSNQNMALYANSSGIKIYTIAYGNKLTEGGKTTLITLASTSGGKYYT
ncbi:MAG: Ig-like domain-containing protein, partial [Methanoregula sp.]